MATRHLVVVARIAVIQSQLMMAHHLLVPVFLYLMHRVFVYCLQSRYRQGPLVYIPLDVNSCLLP